MSDTNRVQWLELKVGLLSLLVGVSDELLQGINPERVFDLRDIFINVVGAILSIVLFKVR
jgi:VanZ family protein